jgi:hypothetical protein
MLERSLMEEQDPMKNSSAGDNQEPEYFFEGFIVEFSEKIMLTPLEVNRSPQDKGQGGS